MPEFVACFFFYFLFFAVWTKKRQALHDVIADTIVVKAACPKFMYPIIGWIEYRIPKPKEAEQGDAFAQLALGNTNESGDDVPKNAVQAVGWYRKASEHGQVSAQSNLGVMYSSGEGVPKDLVSSYMWTNLAAAQGDEIGKKTRDALESLMTKAQIAEAQKLSREWKPKK